MFTYIHLKNFKSFGDVTLDLTDRHGKPKKMVLIYGANGVGKSNLASAFLMLSDSMDTMRVRENWQNFLASKPSEFNDIKIENLLKYHYKDLSTLISENRMIDADGPTLLEFGFELSGKSGKYSMEFDDKQILHERLDYTLEKNRGRFFEVTPEKINISHKIFKKNSTYKGIVDACRMFWGNHTLLSILQYETDDKALSFIQEEYSENLLLLLAFFARMSCRVNFGSHQEAGRISLPESILFELQAGEMPLANEDNLDRVENMLNDFFPAISRDTIRVFYKKDTNESTISYRLMQTKLIAGRPRDIDFSMESRGTQAILNMLPDMLASVVGSTSIIDEFDTGVHDLLINELARSLYDAVDGQLIMTTHNTTLMESGIPKECFYVISEKKDGVKEIAPILFYDPKIHRNANIRNQYLEGKYNGIPEEGDIDFKKLVKEVGL